MRRDLRLEDNTGLSHALRENEKVIVLFIFDSNILNGLEDKKDKRVEFIHNNLENIHRELQQMGSSLLVRYGNPIDIFKQLQPKSVYTNRDYEPYALQRDTEVSRILESKNIPFVTFKDHVIFEKNEVVKTDGTPYTVFTPYSRQWKAKLRESDLASYPVKQYQSHFLQIKPLPFPTLEDVGFAPTAASFPKAAIPVSIIDKYHLQRNFPGIHGTTKLSVHIRFGTVSIRKLVRIGLQKNEGWLNELIWREFYVMILFHFPHVVTNAFKPAYDRIQWQNDLKQFEAWCQGRTGYPIVDAGMRELNETGFMHNRVRMITASFLTKHLLIDWRWGEHYFSKKLLDYDLASNNGGWQWAAGSGCDAAPYFRVFNPDLQTKKFDPDLKYIRTWVKEFGTTDYPAPVVEHTYARERALKTYSQALNATASQ